MIRRQFITGSGEAFPFRIQVNGVYVSLATYIINFKGKADNSAVLSYHLSAASASATVISVPYASVVPVSAKVVKGTFDITDPSGNFERSEPIHITIR